MTKREPARVIGSYISPYVRKVLVFLDLKGIDYEIDPIVPFFGDDRFSRLSPLRRIPVWIDDRVTLSDSSVICQYLEDRHPDPALYPEDVADRARARWLEEFADTRLGDVLIWRYFNQLVIRRRVFDEPVDEAVVKQALEVEIPSALDYLEGELERELEGELPASGFLFGEPGIADISIASFFRTASFARFQVDAGRWPRTAAFVERTLALPSFQKLAVFENALLRTPIAEQREVLRGLGAPLTSESLAAPAPRRGIMPI
jgi:glutathione S-transferase